MKLSLKITGTIEDILRNVWQLPSPAKIIEITTFGDFFVLEGEDYFLYSLTDSEIKCVTELIKEHGLPPVEVALGDEWYQLDALSALEEVGLELYEGQCFGFKVPLNQGGEYALENIQALDLINYHQACSEKGLTRVA